MYEGAARAREVWSPLPAGREAGEAQTAHSWSPRPWPWSQLSHKLTGVLRRFLALCVSSTGRMAQLISEERGSLRLRRPRTHLVRSLTSSPGWGEPHGQWGNKEPEAPTQP